MSNRKEVAPGVTREDMGAQRARAKGRRIAARMLCEIQRVGEFEDSIAGMNPYGLRAADRYQGEPQDNVVLRYLRQAATSGDECIAGFCSVLSDHCSEPIDAEHYLRVSEREINETDDSPTREQILREANHRGISLH